MYSIKKTRSQDNGRSAFQFSRLFLGCVLLAFSLASCTKNSTNNSNNPAVISSQPNTALPLPPLKPLGSMGWDLEGGRRGQFSDFKGKVLVLDFYATWCEPCRSSVPQLVQVQERYGNQGLQVVGLNVGGPDDLNDVKEFASEFKIQYPLGVPEDQLSRFLLSDDGAIPQTFVFDRKGLLVKHIIGYNSETATELEEAIKSALNSPAG